MDGDALLVFLEFRSSPADELTPIFGRGIVVMLALTLLVQVLVSAGVVEVALERTAEHPLITGIRTNAFSFLRTAGLSVVGTALAAGAAGAGVACRRTRATSSASSPNAAWR